MSGFADRPESSLDTPLATIATMRSSNGVQTILCADAHHKRQLRSMSFWAVPLSIAIWAALIAIVR